MGQSNRPPQHAGTAGILCRRDQKTRQAHDEEDCPAVVDKYALWCIDTTPAEIAVAFRIEDEARIGFRDALICAAALKNGAEQILSEDLNAGQKIAGVRIVNPFAHLKSN
jgi:predicted nucleic acid-binding protein